MILQRQTWKKGWTRADERMDRLTNNSTTGDNKEEIRSSKKKKTETETLEKATKVQSYDERSGK